MAGILEMLGFGQQQKQPERKIMSPPPPPLLTRPQPTQPQFDPNAQMQMLRDMYAQSMGLAKQQQESEMNFGQRGEMQRQKQRNDFFAKPMDTSETDRLRQWKKEGGYLGQLEDTKPTPVFPGVQPPAVQSNVQAPTNDFAAYGQGRQSETEANDDLMTRALISRLQTDIPEAQRALSAWNSSPEAPVVVDDSNGMNYPDYSQTPSGSMPFGNTLQAPGFGQAFTPPSNPTPNYATDANGFRRTPFETALGIAGDQVTQNFIPWMDQFLTKVLPTPRTSAADRKRRAVVTDSEGRIVQP